MKQVGEKGGRGWRDHSENPVMWRAEDGLQPCLRQCVYQQEGFKFIMSSCMEPVEEVHNEGGG